MKEKKILGLDLGTNSIGWALVKEYGEGEKRDIALGSRIIPITQDELSDFDKGVTNSAAKERRGKRMMRRLTARRQQRRERLLRVLHVLGFLPQHFDQALGWNKQDTARYAKLDSENEVRLPWTKNAADESLFLFEESFKEMLADFARRQPEWLAMHKVPADWTLYYLRTKALKQAVTREELAWILLSFNQKRGYQMARGEEEEENETKQSEYVETRVVRVEEDEGEKKGKKSWFSLHLENGLVYRRESETSLAHMEGKVLQLIVTREYEKDGKTPKRNKYGDEKVSIRAPKEDDWTLRKKRTEHLLAASGLTVGQYIYQHLLEKPQEKVRGEYVHTIDRHYYKSELKAILVEQMKHHPELTDGKMLEACVQELYARNESHRENLLTKDFVRLFIDDILFYQRPLSSKKAYVDDCPLEKRTFYNRQTGEKETQPLKCVPKSNPFYQEYRIWQWISNLHLYDRETDTDVTATYLPDEAAREELYEWLSVRKNVDQKTLLKDFFGIKKPKGKEVPFPVRWNDVEDRIFPAGETRADMLAALKKAGVAASFLSDVQVEYRLWHLLYSVTERGELERALQKWNMGEEFVQAFLRVKPFESSYGAYSEKAIKKFLPIMRCGKYWKAEEVCEEVRLRLERIQSGQEDPKLLERMSKERSLPHTIEACRALPQWLSSYLIYGRHSEIDDAKRWDSPDDMLRYIRSIRHNSLRNPIVEKVVLETLRVVHDIWKQEGKIDEIHLEMGRELKKSAKERKKWMERQFKNEATNMRLRKLLEELAANNDGLLRCEKVRSYSPSQLDILQIYEEGALARLDEKDKDFEYISKISQQAEPTPADLQRYRLWLEQKYRSPYTGKMISLTQLFTEKYEVEHVIPQSRYFDNSLSNKVICETEINRKKGDMLAYEFIRDHGGSMHETSQGSVKVLTMDEYEQFVKGTFAGDTLKSKRMNLLRDAIPEEFGKSQLNNTRYIARLIMFALSAIVREQEEKEAVSKHLIVCTGRVTDRLKKDWGMHDVWNHLVAPRFERLNHVTGSQDFGHWDNKEGKRVFQTNVPANLQRGYQKKRIDHRHHAMDALIIACTTRSMINFVNNHNASDRHEREQWRRVLCKRSHIVYKPWETFTQDALAALSKVVVTFKQNKRILTSTSNRYEHYDEEGKKQLVHQDTKGLLSIRRSLHKDTVYGRVNLHYKAFVPLKKALELVMLHPDRIVNEEFRAYLLSLIGRGASVKELKAHFVEQDSCWNNQDVSKVEVWKWSEEEEPMVATRKALSPDVKIGDITDTGIQKILNNYLKAKQGNANLAFSPEGIAELNENIEQYNDGRPHLPIKKVRIADKLGEKYQVGQRGNRKQKWVVTDKGTNLFFAIYVDEKGKRSYATPTLRDVIERLKQGLPAVNPTDEKGRKLLFTLSPYDLVYVPTAEQMEQPVEIEDLQPERLFVMRKATGNRCYFLLQSIAKVLYKGVEFGSSDLVESFVAIQPDPAEASYKPAIKEVCWKLEVDRLGRITRIVR